MFKGNKPQPKNALKRVPKWAWYVSAGVAVAAIIYYLRSQQETPVSDDLADEGAVGYTDASVAPGIIVPPVLGGEAVSAELNTDIPSETLGIFGGMFDALTGLVESQGASQTALLEILANGGAGGVNPGADPGGVVATAPPPAAAPGQPKPNPATRLEPGYHAGATVNMGPSARKSFPGAIGWVRVADGDKGDKHWIDVHVRYCDRLERWRVHPNQKGDPWRKIWQGGRPNICA